MGIGYSYSFEKTRAVFTTTGFTIIFTGRAPEGMTVTMDVEETATYDETDNHGVHTEAANQGAGSADIALRATAPAHTLCRQLINLQKKSGLYKGTLTLTDLSGTGSLVIVTNAVLANQPGLTYGAEEPTATFRFRGHVEIKSFPSAPVPFGVQAPPPPL